MCGIAGIFYTDYSQIISETLLSRMTSVLHHRGPDDGSLCIDGSVGLGHRRLQVIDIDGGRQPIFNEDGSAAVVFNGEIYNFQELRKELQEKGHRFITLSDTEVILHAYEEYGEECVNHLRGMFAFAIWNSKKGELFLGRDRFGIKPLYYYWDGRKFMFASEIKAILEDPTVKREINLIALDDYFTYHYIPSPNTIFKGIKKLHPGHTLSVSGQGISEREYWDISFEPQEPGTDSELADGLLEKLNEAIKLHLISDVPLGAFLSGGLDSSAVVAIMAMLLKDPVYTASIGFQEAEFNELSYARLVAAKFKTSSCEKVMESRDSNITDILAWHFDEPFADPAMIPNYYLAKLARERMTVCLSGDGGDESFAGYSRFSNFVKNSEVSSDSAERAFLNAKTLMTPQMKKQLYRDWLKNGLGDYDSFSVMKHYFDRARQWEPLSRVQYVEAKTYLMDGILTKVDRTSMAHSLEVRVPLLDHELVEYVSSIPAEYKLHNGSEKFILKKALREILPSQTLNRGKMGFLVPLAKWLREDLREPFEQQVLSDGSFIGEFLDLNAVRRMWTEHQQEVKDHYRQLWALLVLECWGERFL